MKKVIVSVFCLSLLGVLLVGCGGGEAEAPAPAPIEGEELTAEKFTITKLDGWDYMEVEGGFQIYRLSTNDILQLQVLGSNVTEDEDKAMLETFSTNYSGTPVEEAELLGMKFYVTRVFFNEIEQAFYSTVLDGQQVKLQVTGKDYQSNAEIATMVSSIVFK